MYVKTVKLLLLPRTIVIDSRYLENLNIPTTTIYVYTNQLIYIITQCHISSF